MPKEIKEKIIKEEMAREIMRNFYRLVRENKADLEHPYWRGVENLFTELLNPYIEGKLKEKKLCQKPNPKK